MNPPPLLVLAALASAAAVASAAPGDLDRLGWLAGCWESVSSAVAEPGSVEQWMPIAGGTMLGMSRTVRNGQTYTRDGKTRLLARIEGLRNGTPRSIEFPMVRVGRDAPN